MPELPEVETLKNSIEPKILGDSIISITKNRPNLRYMLPDFEMAINTTIISCLRRAKYLLLNLSNETTLVIHLGMSGQLIFQTPAIAPSKHDHIIFKLSGSTLIYRDPRRFGLVDLLPSPQLEQHKYFASLGPEPLSDAFNAAYLQKALAKRSTPIKQAIMDNKIVVGVGNIYASESLFKSAIHPVRPANSLNIDVLELLVTNIKDTLTQAIKAGGSSIKDFVSSDNNSGYFQQQLLVYGREQQPCKICNTNIEKITQGERASFYCPLCQNDENPQTI